MADNVGYTPGSGALVAADDIAGVLHQRVKIGIGGDGSAVDLSASNPMPITASSAIPISTPSAIDVTVGNFPASQTVSGSVSVSDPSTAVTFGPITTANTVLFAAVDTANEQSIQLQVGGLWTGGIAFEGSDDGTNYFSVQYVNFSDQQAVDTLYAPDTVVVPVTTKFFRAITTRDFVGSVSGTYSLRFAVAPTPFVQSTMVGIDPSVSMPVAGMTPSGQVRRIAVDDNGGVAPADGVVVRGTRLGTQVGPIVQLETTGYGTVVLQLAGTFTGTVTFQVSNDGSTWASAVAWPVAGAAVPVSTATAVGQWLIPAAGRFFRAQLTSAGTGQPLALAVLKNFGTAFPANIPSSNMAQVAGTATVTAGVAGMIAVGGNIAVGSAPTANPVALAWDGTNTRRILTDASSGGVVLGSSIVTNGQTLARFNQTGLTPAATQIKASAGRLTQLTVSNGAAVAGFLHLYNAAAVTLGTTTDVHCYAIPASVANFGIALPDGGLYFSTGIGGAFTAGSANNDNTAFGSAPTLICNYAFI